MLLHAIDAQLQGGPLLLQLQLGDRPDDVAGVARLEAVHRRANAVQQPPKLHTEYDEISHGFQLMCLLAVTAVSDFECAMRIAPLCRTRPSALALSQITMTNTVDFLRDSTISSR